MLGEHACRNVRTCFPLAATVHFCSFVLIKFYHLSFSLPTVYRRCTHPEYRENSFEMFRMTIDGTEVQIQKSSRSEIAKMCWSACEKR